MGYFTRVRVEGLVHKEQIFACTVNLNKPPRSSFKGSTSSTTITARITVNVLLLLPAILLVLLVLLLQRDTDRSN